MILGRFHDRFPRIALRLPARDSAGDVEVEFLLDTGFDGYLTLPGDLVRRLDVQPFGPQTQMLADGTQVECPVCTVTLIWNEKPRAAEVLVLGRRPLLARSFWKTATST